MSKKAKLDGRKLRKAFRENLRQGWEHGRELHPEETPYAFVLYGVEDTPRLSLHLLTEEGLTEVATRYVTEGYYETLEEAREKLRYSIEDSPHFADLENELHDVDALFDPFARELGETEGYKRLAEPAMKAIHDLGEEGLFGTTKSQRDTLLLAIITEDATNDWSLKSAKQLNSPKAFRQFKQAVTHKGQVYVYCDLVTIAADGARMYYDTSPEGDFRETVAADLNGLRITRRWVYRFRSFGSSMSALVVDPHDQSLLALHSKRSECVLLRFAFDSNKPIDQFKAPDDCSSLALSPGGEEILLTCDRSIISLDREFNPIAERELPAGANGVRKLRNGDLLALTPNAVIRMSPKRMKTRLKAVYPHVFRYHYDDAEKIMAVSRFNNDELDFDADREEVYGFRLYRLPSLKLLRTIEVADHQANFAQVSSDGSMVACCLSHTQSQRNYVAVFDTKTGDEIARCRAEYLQEFIWSPNLRAIALTIKNYVGKGVEPIKFWVIPE